MKKGIYKYFLNGELTDINETFFIRHQVENRKFVHSERQSVSFKIKISVQAVLKKDKFELCQIEYETDKIKLCAVYKFSEKNLQFSRKEQGITSVQENFKFAEKAVFFPLMRCFQGQTITQVAENPNFTTVIVPDIQNPQDPRNLLRPIFDERTAKFLKKDPIIFRQSENVSTEANLYQYLSKNYDETSQFWLDDEGFLIFYRFRQADGKIWEVQLQK